MRAMPGPNIKQPCMGCQDRHEGCNGQCKAYQEYAEEMRKRRDFLFKKNQNHYFPTSMKYKKSSGCYVVSRSTAHRR